MSHITAASKVTVLDRVGNVTAKALESFGVTNVGELANVDPGVISTITGADRLIAKAKAALPVEDPSIVEEDRRVSYLIATHNWYQKEVSFMHSNGWVEKAFVTELTVDPDHAVSFIVGWVVDDVEYFDKFSGSFLLYFNTSEKGCTLPPFELMIRDDDYERLPNKDAVQDAIKEIKSIQTDANWR